MGNKYSQKSKSHVLIANTSINLIVAAGYFPVELIGDRTAGIGVEFCHVPERTMIVKGLVMNFHLLNKCVGRRGREQLSLNIQSIYETTSVVILTSSMGAHA